MFSNLTRRTFIAGMAFLLLVGACLFQRPVFAMEPQPSSGRLVPVQSNHILYEDFVIGLTAGQTLRATLANLIGADQREQPPELRAKATLYDAQGRLIAVSEEARIPRGTSFSFDFNRRAILLPGEPRTGRLEVRMVLEGTFDLSFAQQTTSDHLPASYELIDGAGRTVATSRGRLIVLGQRTGKWILDVTYEAGMAMGQSFRLTGLGAADSNSPGHTSEPVRMQVTLFDSSGSQIARSPELDIPSGELGWVDFDRASIDLPGERDTGRLQARVQVRLRFFNGIPSRFSTGNRGSAPIAFEIFDNATGETQVYPVLGTGSVASRDLD